MADVTYTCNVCSQTFNDPDSLKDHMATSHATKTIEVEEGEVKY